MTRYEFRTHQIRTNGGTLELLANENDGKYLIEAKVFGSNHKLGEYTSSNERDKVLSKLNQTLRKGNYSIWFGDNGLDIQDFDAIMECTAL